MLKDDFNGILADFGYNVLVVKQSKTLRCTFCWDERNQSAIRTCPVCFGLGNVPVIEKHTTHSQVLSVPLTLPNAVSTEAFGPMVTSGKVYYFKQDINLSLLDLIVEVDWSPTGKPIYNGGDILEVNFIDIKRYEHGEPTFVKAYVKDQPVRKQIRGIRIANSNGIKNYEILGG